jgi:hypothetical protein
LALLPISILLNSCNVNCISGSGRQVTEDRSLVAFTKVEFGGTIKLKIRQDSLPFMRITADDNIQKLIKTQINGEVLKIEMDGDFCNTGEIIIELGSKQWKGIKASGDTKIMTENQINTNEFDLDLSGSSEVDLDLMTAIFRAESSGSSKINLKGQARKSDINLSGASEINAFDFVVGDYDIKSSGASKCAINVLNSLKINSSGASEVLYKGYPKEIVNDKSGSSTLTHED